MGMAASQARFLQLTARRTNIEYQGQQINQSRLALANASAGLFEKMLNLDVPTPPSSQDEKYYTQGYNFRDPEDDILKKVSWASFKEINHEGNVKIVAIDDNDKYLSFNADDTAFTIKTQGDTYSEKSYTQTELLDMIDGTDVTSLVIDGTTYKKTADGSKIFIVDPLYPTISTNTLAADATITVAGGTTSTNVEHAFTYGDLQSMTAEEVATLTGNVLDPTEEALGYTQAIRYATIEHNVYDPDGNFTTVRKQAPALLEFDNRNRLVKFTLLENPPKVTLKPAGTGTAATDVTDLGEKKRTITSGANADTDISKNNITRINSTGTQSIGEGENLNYSSVFNDQMFQDDMNKYEFQKAAYDYQIEKINIETKQIQVQDRSLELKMKQLDTEHNAVQTEMEAVQKVIQKNIETTFKTFA